MPLCVSSTMCSSHYVPSRAQVEGGLSQPVHGTATYRYDDAVKYNFDLLMMGTTVRETYRGI